MSDIMVNHDVRVVDGKTIYMPPYVDNQSGWGNLALPDLSVPDTVQKYPIGTKYVEGSKVFHYCAFKATVNTGMGAKNGNRQAVAYTTIAAAALQYATSVVVDVAATDGQAGNGAIAVDELAGGEILIFDKSTGNLVYRFTIKSNTVVAAQGGEMTVDIVGKLPAALIADTDYAELMANIYSYVDTTNEKPVIGVPVLNYTNGQFGWVQTWGITWVAPAAAVGVGSNNLLCIFRHDGSIDELDYNDTYNNKGVIAGYVVCRTDLTQSLPFIMLQLAP